MADPKYANLYGIAHDQPDVYETSDLPEADQSEDLYDTESHFIERLHINTAETINLFKNKELDSSTVDFSDNIRRNLGRSGYNVRTRCWEISGYGEKETPAEKLNRIKLELEHLQQELDTDSLSSEQAESSDDIPKSVTALKSETALLLKKISEFGLDAAADNVYTDCSDLDPSSIQFTKLQNKFLKLVNETYSEEDGDDGGKKSSDLPAESGVVKYQLKVKPNQSLLSYTTNISKLEQRLNKLESVIGSGNRELARLSNVCADENGILDYAQWMVTKLSLLDTAQLDTIECRAAAINTRLDQLAEKTGLSLVNQDAEKEKKIDELYDLSVKAKEFSELIPSLLERMTCLESLHQQAKHHIDTLNQLELVQNEMTSKVISNDNSLRNLEEELKSNMSAVNKSVESLQKRMEGLLSSGVVTKLHDK